MGDSRVGFFLRATHRSDLPADFAPSAGERILYQERRLNSTGIAELDCFRNESICNERLHGPMGEGDSR